MADPPKDSILITTKKLLNLGADYTPFDTDIIIHINSVFASLHQMGVGPSTPLIITDESTPWTAFIQGNPLIESVKSYMPMKISMMFDLPTTSFSQESTKEVIKEFEWRLNAASETP